MQTSSTNLIDDFNSDDPDLDQPIKGQYYDFDRNLSIYDMIEEQAHIYKNRIAIRYENEQLSYEQLLNAVNHLANYLIKKNITPQKKHRYMCRAFY